MTVADRAVVALVSGGAIACVLAAALMRPEPFPEAVGAQWFAIAREWTKPVAAASFSLDTVVIGRRQQRYDGRPQTLRAGEPFDVHGWAFDPNFRRAAGRFVYRVDGGSWRDAAYHIPRPDVAAALHLPNVADSGFDVVIPAGSLSPGRHTVELATVDGPSPPLALPEIVKLDVSAR